MTSRLKEPNPDYFREWQYRRHLDALDDDTEQDSVLYCSLCGWEAGDDPILLSGDNLRQIYCCPQCFELRADE